MKNQIAKFGIFFIALAALGFICGGLSNEPFSYIVGIVGGLGMWYMFYGEILK